jgi:hypothetical protein
MAASAGAGSAAGNGSAANIVASTRSVRNTRACGLPVAADREVMPEFIARRAIVRRRWSQRKPRVESKRGAPTHVPGFGVALCQSPGKHLARRRPGAGAGTVWDRVLFLNYEQDATHDE